MKIGFMVFMNKRIINTTKVESPKKEIYGDVTLVALNEVDYTTKVISPNKI